MYKFLPSTKNYVYKDCNPTILSLSIFKKKISLELLDYRPDIVVVLTGRAVLQLYMHFVVTSMDLLVTG
jgi:hypothetical protein